ncbi:hypothetical protein POM88_015387 [Heracleum sosnowskyi]|uniref:KIB1-4 beta-propeller domain-containing protein n=1 Tax=Heracleum sosnowskyi TaxID=360622 RepID=A0AAD8ILI9_9APIA|nr:hypothetical protein POM88_015387 [Heracleum sosnowskyi]
MCTKDKEEKMKRSSTRSPSKWMMKKCSSKLKIERSWADLDLDLLGEIKKKLYYGDHARFSGVCKSSLAAQHEKRAADVLPCLLLVFRDENLNKFTYNLYQPLNLRQPIISQVSILTKKATTLPQFNYPEVPAENFKVFKAVSTCPGYSDCVFLVLHVANYLHWSLGIFFHGDTQWTTHEFQSIGYPVDQDAVCIGGVFYFLCHDQRLVSVDIASGELKVDTFSTPLDYGGIQKFFGLDGELMLMYCDKQQGRKSFLTSYDWLQKLWVPVKSLGDRSLFLSEYSVYVDDINYYGVSPNKIYIQKHGTCCVYSFENDELLESTSSGLRNWDEDDDQGIQWSLANQRNSSIRDLIDPEFIKVYVSDGLGSDIVRKFEGLYPYLLGLTWELIFSMLMIQRWKCSKLLDCCSTVLYHGPQAPTKIPCDWNEIEENFHGNLETPFDIDKDPNMMLKNNCKVYYQFSVPSWMFLSYHDSNGSEDSDVFQKSEMYCSMNTLKDDKKAVTGILRNYAILILKWQGLHVQDHTLMSKKFNAQSLQVNQHLIRSICKTLARKFCLIVNFCIEVLSTISFTGRCCLIVILFYRKHIRDLDFAKAMTVLLLQHEEGRMVLPEDLINGCIFMRESLSDCHSQKLQMRFEQKRKLRQTFKRAVRRTLKQMCYTLKCLIFEMISSQVKRDYSAFFDSLDAMLSKYDTSRAKVEQFYFAHVIKNIVCCEAPALMERHEMGLRG